MKRPTKILLFIFLVGFSISCSSFQPPKYPSYEWVNLLITDPVCESPCWENITPGETEISTITLDSLRPENRLKFDNIENGSQGEQCINWYSTQDKTGKMALIEMCTSPNEEEIGSISFEFGLQHTNINISDFINHYGEPDKIIISQPDGRCQGALIYEKLNMLINLSVQTMNNNYIVRADTHLTRSYFGTQQYINQMTEIYSSRNNPVDWAGFGKYKCR
jgi:hypothetical protein